MKMKRHQLPDNFDVKVVQLASRGKSYLMQYNDRIKDILERTLLLCSTGTLFEEGFGYCYWASSAIDRGIKVGFALSVEEISLSFWGFFMNDESPHREIRLGEIPISMFNYSGGNVYQEQTPPLETDKLDIRRMQHQIRRFSK